MSTLERCIPCAKRHTAILKEPTLKQMSTPDRYTPCATWNIAFRKVPVEKPGRGVDLFRFCGIDFDYFIRPFAKIVAAN
jgi:hypothetical protein